jgi:hypothetical protein
MFGFGGGVVVGRITGWIRCAHCGLMGIWPRGVRGTDGCTGSVIDRRGRWAIAMVRCVRGMLLLGTLSSQKHKGCHKLGQAGGLGAGERWLMVAVRERVKIKVRMGMRMRVRI